VLRHYPRMKKCLQIVRRDEMADNVIPFAPFFI